MGGWGLNTLSVTTGGFFPHDPARKSITYVPLKARIEAFSPENRCIQHTYIYVYWDVEIVSEYSVFRN